MTRPWVLAAMAFVVATGTAAAFLIDPPHASAFLASRPDGSSVALIAAALTFAVAAVIEHDG